MTPVNRFPSARRVFCNRTLNMKSIGAIGYDMDYTLIHYHADIWEQKAYHYLKQQFLAQGWPVENLTFDPTMACRGLIIDKEKGNLVKANRFGFVKRAMHGSKPMDFEEQRETYSRLVIDLADSRWVFLNTLFSLSEGCIYAQLVELLDQKKIPEVLGYASLYDRVRIELEQAHLEGQLKAEIIANPDSFVVLDPEAPLALLDQKNAGKKLMLITNSEWNYTVPMMTYTFDRFLPKGMTWRDLFDVVIIGARKPNFFTMRSPFFEVVTEDGLLKPVIGKLAPGKAYLGGSAWELERHLNLPGDEILYVGDHMFADVHVTKNVLRWRTALILREMEEEILALESFRKQDAVLATKMKQKEQLESELFQIRVELQRTRLKYGPTPAMTEEQLQKQMGDLKLALENLDDEIIPLAKGSAELSNSNWGLLMRAGNDKSYLAYQMERYADVYTSRVSNLLAVTPFTYLRSPKGSLPHDPGF